MRSGPARIESIRARSGAGPRSKRAEARFSPGVTNGTHANRYARYAMESPYRIPQPMRTPDPERILSEDLSRVLFDALCLVGFYVAVEAIVKVLAG
jgi:hypothetical protein